MRKQTDMRDKMFNFISLSHENMNWKGDLQQWYFQTYSGNIMVYLARIYIGKHILIAPFIILNKFCSIYDDW